ncbi:MAG: hypothetical protein FWH29_04895 [Methanobrevibacter sp.]|nr:hypothetical protein [Methanobrevibacter sp.]
MKNIILIGSYMVGTHTLGKRAAEILNLDFIDIDEFIWKKFQESEGYKDSDFKKVLLERICRKNAQYFFEKEYYPFLKELKTEKISIITGSPDLALTYENLSFLREIGTLINIKRDNDIILKQIQDNYPEEWKQKNAINNGQRIGDMRELHILEFEEAIPYYEEIADFTIDNNKSKEEGVNKLVNQIKKIWDEDL